MTKIKETKEELDENLFGNFKFIDQTVPKEVKTSKKEKASESKEEATTSEKEIQLDADKAKLIEEAEKKTLEKVESKTKKAKKVEETEKLEDDEEDSSTIDEQELQEEETQEDTESALQVFATELRDKGILDIEDPSLVKTEDDLYEGIKNTVKNYKESYKQSLPKDGQEFLEFIENGGNPKDFHKYYYSSDTSFEEFEMKSDEDREYIIREGLALEEYTEEEIEEELEGLRELGKLEKKSDILLKKLQRFEKDQKKLLLDSQKEYAKQEEARRASQWEEFKKGLFEKDTISGFKFTEKMKNDTWDYMTKIVNKKEGLTQYQIDSQSNPDARYIFAYLLKNKWDKKSLEQEVKNKAISKLTSKLNNYTDTRSKIKSGTVVPEKEKDTTSSFANFRKLL